jgi:predicted CXXCH cytochrome family protein
VAFVASRLEIEVSISGAVNTAGSNRKWTLVPLAIVALSALAGCVDEKIVFRDRELFEEPLAAAGNFLGYTSTDDKLTVCGNCHVGPQAEWENTAHADAWATLQANPGAQTFCEGCHTVGELGNPVTAMAGHSATGEARYQDVQCESCHGPGLEHVQLPSDATVPMASMDVGLTLTTGCAECHQGEHHPFANEWAGSGHGKIEASPAGRAECEGCHTGEGALAAFGVNTIYREQADVALPGQHLAITCAVCHDPHGSDNPAQLRFPINTPSTETNLCMKCHQKRGEPDPTSSRGPHSPEGPTLLGTAGWWPPGLTGRFVGTHGSLDANPELCAGCHVNRYAITDAATGAFVFNVTGHSFEATPCVDAQGIPVAGPCTNAEKTYKACVGCHAEDVAETLVDGAETDIAPLIAQLQALVDAVQASMPGEFSTSDDRYTVAEGSKFNLGLAEAKGSVVHNVFLIRALLNASIAAMQTTYP